MPKTDGDRDSRAHSAPIREVLAPRGFLAEPGSETLLRLRAPMLVWLAGDRLLFMALPSDVGPACFLAVRLSLGEWNRVARSAMTLEAAFLASRVRGEVWFVEDCTSVPLTGRRLADIPSAWLPEPTSLEEMGVRIAAVADTFVAIARGSG